MPKPLVNNVYIHWKHLRRGLSLGSGPGEKVASDFTSVPDPSERRSGKKTVKIHEIRAKI